MSWPTISGLPIVDNADSMLLLLQLYMLPLFPVIPPAPIFPPLSPFILPLIWLLLFISLWWCYVLINLAAMLTKSSSSKQEVFLFNSFSSLEAMGLISAIRFQLAPKILPFPSSLSLFLLLILLRYRWYTAVCSSTSNGGFRNIHPEMMIYRTTFCCSIDLVHSVEWQT